MNRRNLKTYLFALVMILPLGCTVEPPAPPHTLGEYERLQATHPGAYPQQTLLLKNLQRVLDSERPTPQRMESLKLVLHIGSDDPTIHQQLAAVLHEPHSPYELRRSVLTILMENNYPGLADYVIPSLSNAEEDPALRDALLQWLSRNPSPVVLSQVVKIWAEESSPAGLNEPRYRHIVERISGRSWDDTLLAGINNPEPFERGRALEILTRRLSSAVLKQRILSANPQSEAMASLQSFQENFDYLPSNRAEFAAVATLFKTQLAMIRDASRLAWRWRDEYGYVFNVRDFHLLSRLVRDPLRPILRRTRLVLELGQAIYSKEHVSYSLREANAGDVYTDRLSRQVDDLSISDIWNLYLLNDMLRRPRMQLALAVMADHSRADSHSASSGLVYYQHGQAEAMLYPAADNPNIPARGEVVTPQMVRDGRDGLCRFITHFEKVYNTSQVGPDADELRQAKMNGYYGLILTGIDELTFAAHYYNPDGAVVSLGKYPFRK